VDGILWPEKFQSLEGRRFYYQRGKKAPAGNMRHEITAMLGESWDNSFQQKSVSNYFFQFWTFFDLSGEVTHTGTT
jgi:hypothetical protein